MEKMREEFEEWYASQVSDDNVVQIDLWSAWQASRAALCVELPEGWQLVPAEPTREMIWACKERFVPRIALPIFAAAYKTMVAAAHNPTVGKQVNINPNKDNK